MRRNDREVTDNAEILDIMSRCEVLRLAIHAEPAPYLLPVNFGMEPDGAALYIHGAIVCGGGSILRAWQQAESDGSDYLQHAQAAVERMKRNLLRYVTIL